MQDYIPQKIDINGQIGEIVVKQFDNLSRFLNVQITDNDNPESTVFNLTGCVARLFVQVGDTPVYIDGEIADEENGVLSFNLTSGLTQTVGKFPCEIRITNAEEQSIISTRQFTLTVLDSLFDSDALESSPQYSALENALFQIAIDRARLNHLESMAEAGTAIPGTAQAELADIRTGYDGTVYSSAGAAVRGQIDDIYSSIRPATAAEFAAAMGEDIPEQAEEIANDLQRLLDGANGWESRINAVETGLAMTQQNIPALIPNGGITEAMLSGAAKRNGGGFLALEYLGDSFIDYRAEELCHNCQGFTADDDYFYLYRAGKLRYENNVLQTDKPCGHLQKIDRETLATVAEKDFFPTVSNGALTSCGLEHGNDMTVITLGGTEYLLAVAGNNLANGASHFGVWLLRTDNLNIVASTTLSVSEQDEDEESASDKAIYRIAAVKGSNVLFLAHRSIVYRTTVTLSGGVLTVGTPVAQEGIALTGNQGMDCDGARLYCLDAWSRTLEIVSLSDKSIHRLKLETVMQGFIMAEPEGVAVDGDDVFIAGGTNCNSIAGISQTLLCHGNLRTPICAFSKKANIRNLEDPIALFAGKAIVTAATLSALPETGNISAYYYVGSGSSYTLYRWEKGDNKEYSYQEKGTGITSVPDNDSDDGSYDFVYHTGFSGHPFSSIYSAWMAAKSLFLLGLGVQFNIHVNLPIRKPIHLYGGGFSVALTTDLPSVSPNGSTAKLVLHHVDGTVDLSLPALEVIGGQINLTGSIGTLTAREGAVVFTNSSDDFTPADSSYNFLVLGRNAIYTRFGTVAYTPYSAEETPPVAPASITATAGSGSIAVTWAESSGAAYYTLERKAGSGAWSAIAQNYTGRSYTDNSVTAGTSYQYRVTAHKIGTSGVLSSSPTTSSTVTAAGTPSGNVTLDAPVSVTATAGSGQISVTWGAVSGASRYQLERSADNGATWTTLLLYQTANSYTDTTVASGTSYQYRVTAFSSSGDTSPAAVSSSTTPQAAPAAVIGGRAILSPETAATVVNNITVGWNLGNTLDCCNDPVQLRTGQANSVFGAGIRSIGSENEGKTYETSWGDAPITTQEMLEAVVNAGFNAIRIPVTWNHHLRDAALPYDWGVDVIDSGRYTTDIPLYPNLSGTVIISPFFLKRVKEVVNMALNAGFQYVILDTHHDTADFNSASSRTLYYAKNVTGLPWLTDIPYQLFHCSNRLGPRLENVSGMTAEKDFQNMCDYMYQLWTMIATEFKDYDYRLIFEGFNEMLNWARAWDQTYHAGNNNEVTATQHQKFNAFNNTFIKAVRNAGGAYNPTRVLSCETFGATTTDFIVNGFSLSNVPDSFKSTNYCLTDNEISAENSRIILQAHYYNDVPNNFQAAAESVASAGLPVIFGEVGWNVNSGAPSDLYNFGYNLVQKAKSAGAKVFWWDNNKTGTGKDCYGVLNRWNTKNGIVAWHKEALKDGLIAGANAT